MIRIENRVLLHGRLLLLLGLTTLFISNGISQSTLQDHPTPITRNEVSGMIKPRDLGDARLTTHYFWFEGSQGDVFINLTSKNFTGDIDVFAQNGLRTLSKIIVYADFGEVETGRVVYLRKQERLLLRVQGRSPNEEPATYRFKFAGSFVAATGDESDVPEMPKVSESAISGVPVNSAGTKLPLPKPIEKTIETETASAQPSETAKTKEAGNTNESVIDESEKKPETKPEVVVTDPIREATPAKSNTTAKRPPRRTRTTQASTPKTESKTDAQAQAQSEETTSIEPSSIAKKAGRTDSAATSNAKEIENESPKAEKPADPLANIHLVILFKNGSKIERPLTEVQRFSVDRGVLTVVSKNGTTGKYQMLEVTKVTIE